MPRPLGGVVYSKSIQRGTALRRDVEKTVPARALKLVFEDRVFVSGNRTIIFD